MSRVAYPSHDKAQLAMLSIDKIAAPSTAYVHIEHQPTVIEGVQYFLFNSFQRTRQVLVHSEYVLPLSVKGKV